MRPTIGITCGLTNNDRNTYGLRREYVCAIEDAGGIPVIIPLLKENFSLNDVTLLIDGLLLSGGGDIDPSFYNEECQSELRSVNIERDKVEIELVLRALDNNMPIFGICRGIQVLNVAAGGTLYQDISSCIETHLQHFQSEPGDQGTHLIHISENSKLTKIMRSKTVLVNSFHHQAVKDVADDFIVTAVSDDGIVEAIESVKHPFAIGVQFHPERMWEKDESIRSLFISFVGAAKIYSKDKNRCYKRRDTV